MNRPTALAAIALTVAVALSGCAATTGGDTTTTTTTTTTSDTPQAPAEHAAALTKARVYAESLNMSRSAIRKQLAAPAGENFPADAIDYAMTNLDGIDWNANALVKAEFYRDQMAMSTTAIREQLTSEYGEGFTAGEADYAITHLAR